MAQANAPTAQVKPGRAIAAYRLDPERGRPPCRYCRRPNLRPRADSCGVRDCPGYIDLWLGDQRMRLFMNLEAYGGEVVMTTITAPRLEWDTDHCAGLGPHRCSGLLGCRVEPEVAGDFNLTAAPRLSALHKAAMQSTYRKFGPGTCRRLAYAPELQARGVVHWHVVLGFGSVREKFAARYYVNELHRLASSYGYGFVDRKLEPAPPLKAAWYLSKYLTKVESPTGGLRELIVRQEAPARPVYVANSLTETTRATMRNLRRWRAAYVMWRVRLEPAEVEMVWEVMRVFPGVRVEAAADPPTAAP